MDNEFRLATDALGLPAADVAAALNSPVQSYRQARLDRTNRNYRPPPTGWQAVVANLARRRVKELQRLCAALGI